MPARLKRRPRPAVLVAALALVVAVAGPAIAVPLAEQSALNKKEKKQTKSIVTNQLNALSAGLTVAKAANVDSFGGGVTEATLTVGRSGSDATCDPAADNTFVDCVGATVTLPRSGRVLIVAAGGQSSFTGVAEGDCRLEVDDATTAVPGPNNVSPGEEAIDNTISVTAVNGFAYSATTNVLPAGSHTFELSCDQASGNQEIENSSISAVMVGSG